MEYVLETNALTKRYRKFTALNGLFMHVPKGSIYGFVGRNGAGKTTLIRLICGLQEPTDGKFELYGAQSGTKEIYKARRRIGALVETPAIYRDMTAKENLKQQYRVLGLPSFDGIEELLALVGLSDSDKKKAGHFSLGMRQRLAIAIALCGDPDFLVLDEPMNGLDPQGIIEMRELILKLNREKRQKYVSGDAELKKAVTNISHDLRTPLTSICGYLDLLEEENLSKNGKRYLSVIHERTDAMRLLTEELFRYSVVTSKEEVLKLEEVSLNDVLEQSLAAFYGVFSSRGITPEIKIPDFTVFRTLDKSALRRIFDNILSNAAKYSDGDLKVELSKDGTVTFSNSAKKLDRVETERLFDRFYTVETASGSTGLGLSIAKVLTEKLGGFVSADYHGERLFVVVGFSK